METKQNEGNNHFTIIESLYYIFLDAHKMLDTQPIFLQNLESDRSKQINSRGKLTAVEWNKDKKWYYSIGRRCAVTRKNRIGNTETLFKSNTTHWWDQISFREKRWWQMSNDEAAPKRHQWNLRSIHSVCRSSFVTKLHCLERYYLVALLVDDTVAWILSNTLIKELIPTTKECALWTERT